jgi:hypothetical protein
LQHAIVHSLCQLELVLLNGIDALVWNVDWPIPGPSIELLLDAVLPRLVHHLLDICHAKSAPGLFSNHIPEKGFEFLVEKDGATETTCAETSVSRS